MEQLYEKAGESAAFLQGRLPGQPKIAVCWGRASAI